MTPETMNRVASFLGLVFFIVVIYLLSNNRKKIEKRVLFWGLGLQFAFAILVLGIPALGVPGVLRFLFSAINTGVMKILAFSDAGASFVFGPLIDTQKMGGFIFAFSILPTIIFF